MKSILAVIACGAVALFAVSARAQNGAARTDFQVVSSRSKLLQCIMLSGYRSGCKVIVVDPAKPAVFTGLPQADLICSGHPLATTWILP